MSKKVPSSPNKIVMKVRDLIQKNDRQVYQFLFLMSGGSPNTAQWVIQVFREFGQRFRKRFEKFDSAFLEMEIRRALFSVAWGHFQKNNGPVSSLWHERGRDLRVVRDAELNLLAEKSPEVWDAEFLKRLCRVDMEFRAPLILKDVLNFDDEDVIHILKLRWGVYRHRLNRGRLEFCEELRGKRYEDFSHADEAKA